MGYHAANIARGTFGEFSKIREEFEEAQDADRQNNPIMTLLELADLIGAIEAFAAKHNMKLQDVLEMHYATKRAFADGTRTSREPESTPQDTFDFDQVRMKGQPMSTPNPSMVDWAEQLKEVMAEIFPTEKRTFTVPTNPYQRQHFPIAGQSTGVEPIWTDYYKRRQDPYEHYYIKKDPGAPGV